MRRAASLLVIYLALALLAPARAYEFDIGSGQRLCFTEDLPEGVNFRGTYAAGGTPNYPIAIEIRSPLGLLYSHPNVTEEGRFAFVVTAAGSHTICFIAQNSSEGQPGRPCMLSVDSGRLPVSTGTSDADKQNIALQVSEITKEMQKDYQLQVAKDHELTDIASKVGRTMMVSSLVCVIVIWVVALATTYWISGMVRKRL